MCTADVAVGDAQGHCWQPWSAQQPADGKQQGCSLGCRLTAVRPEQAADMRCWNPTICRLVQQQCTDFESCPPAELVLLQRIHACLEEDQLWLVALKQQVQPVLQLGKVLIIRTVVRQGHVIRAGAASAPGPVLGACVSR